MGGHSERDNNCVQRGLTYGFGGFALGAFGGAAEAAWQQPPHHKPNEYITMGQALKIVRSRAAVLSIAAMAFSVTECTMDSLLGDQTPAHSAVGGVASGVVFGLAAGSPMLAFGSAVGLGVTMAAFDSNGREFMPRHKHASHVEHPLRTPKSEH